MKIGLGELGFGPSDGGLITHQRRGVPTAYEIEKSVQPAVQGQWSTEESPLDREGGRPDSWEIHCPSV